MFDGRYFNSFMNIEKESNLDPTSDRAYRVQDIGLAGVLKKHVVT
jgi:hypothetical protein